MFLGNIKPNSNFIKQVGHLMARITTVKHLEVRALTRKFKNVQASGLF